MDNGFQIRVLWVYSAVPVPCSMYQFTVVTVFCFQNRLLRVNNKGNSVPAKLADKCEW